MLVFHLSHRAPVFINRSSTSTCVQRIMYSIIDYRFTPTLLGVFAVICITI